MCVCVFINVISTRRRDERGGERERVESDQLDEEERDVRLKDEGIDVDKNKDKE